MNVKDEGWTRNGGLGQQGVGRPRDFSLLSILSTLLSPLSPLLSLSSQNSDYSHYRSVSNKCKLYLSFLFPFNSPPSPLPSISSTILCLISLIYFSISYKFLICLLLFRIIFFTFSLTFLLFLCNLFWTNQRNRWVQFLQFWFSFVLVFNL